MLVSFFCIAIPLGALLAFYFELGLLGLQIANAVGAVFVFFANQWVITKFDIQEVADQVQKNKE